MERNRRPGAVQARCCQGDGAEADHEKAAVGAVEQAQSVMARLDVRLRPDHTVDHHVIPEEFCQRRGPAAVEERSWQDRSLVGDELLIEGITRVRGIKQLAPVGEHAVLNGIGEFVRKRGKAECVVRLTRVPLVAHEIEAREPRIHVQPRDAQRMIVIPESARGHVVVVTKQVREPAGHEVPLRPRDAAARAVEELGVAVELEFGVPAVQVRDNRNAVFPDAVLAVVYAVGGTVAVKGIAPVQVRIHRQQVRPNEQLIRPAYLCPGHAGQVGSFHFERAARPGGPTLIAVAPDGCGQQPARWRVNEAGLLHAWPDGHVELTHLIRQEPEARVERIGCEVSKFRLECGIAQSVTRRFGDEPGGP